MGLRYCANSRVYNNLLIQDIEPPAAYCYSYSKGTAAGLKSDYNSFQYVNGKFAEYQPSEFGAVSYYNTLTDWQNAQSRDLTSIEGDPILNGDDYHLSDTSPCIDVGCDMSTSGITDDIDAEDRPYNLIFDIGCDESQPVEIQYDTPEEKFYIKVPIANTIMFVPPDYTNRR